MSNYTVTLKVSDLYSQFDSKEQLESALRDLLMAAALPAIGLELTSSTITKSKN